jgi:hypothetical protein
MFGPCGTLPRNRPGEGLRCADQWRPVRGIGPAGPPTHRAPRSVPAARSRGQAACGASCGRNLPRAQVASVGGLGHNYQPCRPWGILRILSARTLPWSMRALPACPARYRPPPARHGHTLRPCPLSAVVFLLCYAIFCPLSAVVWRAAGQPPPHGTLHGRPPMRAARCGAAGRRPAGEWVWRMGPRSAGPRAKESRARPGASG